MITTETIRVFECEDWDNLYIESEETSFYTSKETKNIEPEIVEYSSFDDFFKKLESENGGISEYSNSTTINNYEIKKGNHKQIDIRDNNVKIPKVIKKNSSECMDKNEKCDKAKIIERLKSKELQIRKTLMNDECKCEDNPFGEEWSNIAAKIKSISPFRKFSTYLV